ncbi:MAG TPA: hypothetical protein VLG47_05440 [Candidatus Saccharimonadales bacterium]|nr:hypothetical protein [Candidatus Saccharimonadales bacterium]
MERFTLPEEDRVVYEVKGDLELTAIELLVQAYSDILRNNGLISNADLREIVQAANNISERFQSARRADEHAKLLGIENPVASNAVHVFDIWLGQIAEEAILMYSLDPRAFGFHLSEDEMITVESCFPFDDI